MHQHARDLAHRQDDVANDGKGLGERTVVERDAIFSV